jgi:hypothetical protein
MIVSSLPCYRIDISDSFLAISICLYIAFIFPKYKVLWNFAVFGPSGDIGNYMGIFLLADNPILWQI